MRASGVLGASGVPGASRAQKTPKAPKEQRFGLRSVYARFALVFLGIWWVSNAATLIMIFSLIPESRADEVRSLIGLIFINNAVFGTIVILLALRGVVKPIKLLSSAAREVAEGNFALTVDVRSRDEIGGLAANFNTMITEIAGTDKMRREFVSNVSHEFRTPMTSIHGFAKLIDENAEDREAVREYSNIILRESERLIDMSSALLRLSELDAKAISVTSEFLLDEQLRQVILLLQPQWEAKNIEFDLALAEVRYLGEEDLLWQVWLNLIQNAIKFSPERAAIEVTVSQVDDAVTVAVANEGPGISSDDISHIFERFYKGDTARAHLGNGLGLSIVQKAVQFSGGSISVESEMGGRTIFTLVLPAGQPRR